LLALVLGACENVKDQLSKTDEVCEKCGRPMAIKYGPHGKFLGCSGFPECRNTKSITTGVKCPQPDCGGERYLGTRSGDGRS